MFANTTSNVKRVTFEHEAKAPAPVAPASAPGGSWGGSAAKRSWDTANSGGKGSRSCVDTIRHGW